MTLPRPAYVGDEGWAGSTFVHAAAASGERALVAALDAASRHGHTYLGCEHLFAGVLNALGDGLAGVGDLAALAEDALGRTPADTVVIRHGWQHAPALPSVTPRARRVMQRAIALSDGTPSAEHLLVAVLEDPGVVGSSALVAGVDLPAVLARARARLGWANLAGLVREAGGATPTTTPAI